MLYVTLCTVERQSVIHNIMYTCFVRETMVAQWLRCCVTNRKVAGSIPAGVIEIFH